MGRGVIDWLRRASADPVVELAGRSLPIALRRHPTARRLTMRLAPDGSEVRVTMPKYCPSREALNFVEARRDWLEQQLEKLAPQAVFTASSPIPYRGKDLTLNWQERAPRRAKLVNGALYVGGPEEGLAKRVQRWLESEALGLLQADLAHYCQRAALPAPALRLSRAQRRWGSCSTSGTVRINWRLVMAPDHVRRSVVAHEVAHLVHFDHSPAFHALLGELFEEDIKRSDRWLKSEGRSLYNLLG
ncbi:MAG: M48 family metallopeptidase [Sphingomonadaceae bacterium]|nr:M48 family metallopeptidase [Sphingomonadaceae bacterium]